MKKNPSILNDPTLSQGMRENVKGNIELDEIAELIMVAQISDRSKGRSSYAGVLYYSY